MRVTGMTTLRESPFEHLSEPARRPSRWSRAFDWKCARCEARAGFGRAASTTWVAVLPGQSARSRAADLRERFRARSASSWRRSPKLSPPIQAISQTRRSAENPVATPKKRVTSGRGPMKDLAAGQALGRYELLLPIAKGGMAQVWAARLRGTRGFRVLKTMLGRPVRLPSPANGLTARSAF